MMLVTFLIVNTGPFYGCTLGVVQTSFGFEVRSSEATSFTSFRASGEATSFRIPGEAAGFQASGLQVKRLASRLSLASGLQAKPVASKLRAKLRSQ